MKDFLKNLPFVRQLTQSMPKSWKDKLETGRLKKCGKSKQIRIVIGASGICDSGWTATDIEYLSLLDGGQWAAYFAKNSIDAMLAEHVWEHLTGQEALEAAKRCFDYLKPGGYIRVAVPDGYHPDKKYIEHVRPGGTGSGADDHKILYDHRMLLDIFERAGFRVSLLEYFDVHGVFHSIDWNVQDGMIHRSRRFDERNAQGKLNYTSLIIDAHKDK